MRRFFLIALLIFLNCGSDNTIATTAPEVNPLLGTWQIDKVEYYNKGDIITYGSPPHSGAIGLTQNTISIYLETNSMFTFSYIATYSKTSTTLICQRDSYPEKEILAYQVVGSNIIIKIGGEVISFLSETVTFYATKLS